MLSFVLLIQINLGRQPYKIQLSNRLSHIARHIHLIRLVNLKTEVRLVLGIGVCVLVHHFHVQLHNPLVDLLAQSHANDSRVVVTFFED